MNPLSHENPVETQEVWKDIPGYPGYQVSDFGRVATLVKRGSKAKYYISNTRTVMRQSSRHLGRLYATIRKNNRAHQIPIHRLVLLAFIGPCPERMECCHNDGNHLNNYLSNLRWDTCESNWADRKIHGVARIGEKSHLAKLTNEKVIIIRFLYHNKISAKRLASLFNLHEATIHCVINGRRWKHVPNHYAPISRDKISYSPTEPAE